MREFKTPLAPNLLIPIPGNNFIFKRGPCAENRLKKKGLYFSILAPSFLSDLSAAFTLLKCEIISWDWYYLVHLVYYT
jgi:hypothetical protein